MGNVRHSNVMGKFIYLQMVSRKASMARIPDSDLQRLKEEISVQRLIEASGLELKKSGKD